MLIYSGMALLIAQWKRPIVIDKTSKYNLQLQLTKAPDYGKFDIHLDEKKIASGIDL